MAYPHARSGSSRELHHVPGRRSSKTRLPAISVLQLYSYPTSTGHSPSGQSTTFCSKLQLRASDAQDTAPIRGNRKMENSPIGCLPIELRLRVYNNLLPRRTFIEIRKTRGDESDDDGSDESDDCWTVLTRDVFNLMALCREVREEVVPECFGRKQVVINAKREPEHATLDVDDVLSFVAHRERTLLQAILIMGKIQCIHISHVPWVSDLENHAKKSLKMLRTTKAVGKALPQCKVAIWMGFAVADDPGPSFLSNIEWKAKVPIIESTIRGILAKLELKSALSTGNITIYQVRRRDFFRAVAQVLQLVNEGLSTGAP